MDKRLFPVVLIILTLTACTQSLADTTPLPPPVTVALTVPPNSSVPIPLPTFTPITQPTFGGETGTYAVILVPGDDMLNIRSGPGVENAVVETLAPKETGISRTGKTSSVGDDMWVEIQNPGGGSGWVNADFLTEYVTPLAFCGDARVTMLLRDLETAVNTTDAELFKSLVSPAHGLDMVYIRGGMVANYTPEEAYWAFQSTYKVDWGLGYGSGEPVTGTFPEVVLPALQDVFKNVTFICNEVKLGGATYPVEWLGEYTNINFYALHNPGTEPFGGLDWRIWLAGVEYVDGQPYLFALLNYQWEP